MDKACPGCRRVLDESEFDFKVRRTGRRQPYCRGCTREQVRNHYRRNVDYYVSKARARKPGERRAVRAQLLA